MVNRNLIREFDVSEEDWNAAVGEAVPEEMDWLVGEDVSVNQIVEGTVLRVDNEFVLVDVGYKSEGIIPRSEWEEEELELPEAGEKVRVLVEDVEDTIGRHDDRGMIVLSKRKAEKIEKWLKVMETVAEGDVVKGMVNRKIKGGLLVDIGVNVFLPASQVDIRRPHDIGEYIGKEIECMVLKIDETRRNIVVSRRSLDRGRAGTRRRRSCSRSSKSSQIRKGVVKNLADFGAFVDLGGIDGLLHITDMSWGRINHPSEMVKIDDEIEVMILQHRLRQRERLHSASSRNNRKPVGRCWPPSTLLSSKVHKGTVVNVMSYGAFVKLEDGIEGLVHISEMSWTKRINHPNELVQIDDEVEVVVLEALTRRNKKSLLGMKQTQDNPLGPR